MLAEPIHTDHAMRGILLRVLAAVLLSIIAALVKIASARGVSGPELLFYTSGFALAVVTVKIRMGPGFGVLATRRPVAHMWRSIVGISANLLYLQALIMLPLAEATTISFSTPAFATIMSWLVLRETVSGYRWGAVLAGLAGVAIVMQPSGGGHSIAILGAAIALCAAVGQAGVSIILRHLRSENVLTIVFWSQCAGLVVGAMLLPVFGKWHDLTTLAIIGAMGVAIGFAQLAMTDSLRSAPVAVVMPFDYLQIVGALILGLLIFGASLRVNTLLGAALICSAGLYVLHREGAAARRATIRA